MDFICIVRERGVLFEHFSKEMKVTKEIIRETKVLI